MVSLRLISGQRFQLGERRVGGAPLARELGSLVGCATCPAPRTHHEVTRQNGPDRRTVRGLQLPPALPGESSHLGKQPRQAPLLGQCRGDPVGSVPASPLSPPAAACPRLPRPQGLPGRVRPRSPRGFRPASNEHLLQSHTLQPKGGPLIITPGPSPSRRSPANS